MDSEMAFEMLSCLHHESAQRQQCQRFDEWVSALRTGAPEAYQENVAYLIGWQIENAFASGADAALPTLVRELSGEAGAQPDIYQTLLDKLAYHGQTALLLEAIEQGWPWVKDSAELLEWAIDDFARQAVEFTVLDHIERHPDGSGDEAALIQRLSEYRGGDELDPERLKHYLTRVYGRDERLWNGDDFVPNNKELQRLMPLRDGLLTMCQQRFDDPAPEQTLAAWPDNNPISVKTRHL